LATCQALDGQPLSTRGGAPISKSVDPTASTPNGTESRSPTIEMRRLRVLPPGSWTTGSSGNRQPADAGDGVAHRVQAISGRSPWRERSLATLSVGLYLFHLPPGYAVAWRSLPLGLGALLWIPNLCVSVIGPIGLTFFTLFPRPLFQRRWPWVLVWLPTLCLLPIDASSIYRVVYHPDEAYGRVFRRSASSSSGGRVYGVAMLAAIAASYLRLSEVNERRRLRVLDAGGRDRHAAGALQDARDGGGPRSALRDFLVSPRRPPDHRGVSPVPHHLRLRDLRHRLLDVR
jgi:hypothetical protein